MNEKYLYPKFHQAENIYIYVHIYILNDNSIPVFVQMDSSCIKMHFLKKNDIKAGLRQGWAASVPSQWGGWEQKEPARKRHRWY